MRRLSLAVVLLRVSLLLPGLVLARLAVLGCLAVRTFRAVLAGLAILGLTLLVGRLAWLAVLGRLALLLITGLLIGRLLVAGLLVTLRCRRGGDRARRACRLSRLCGLLGGR